MRTTVNIREAVNEHADQLYQSTAATDARTGSRERAVLLVDSNGRFMVKGKNQAVIHVGRDPKAPAKEELAETMDFEVHKRCYYMNYA